MFGWALDHPKLGYLFISSYIQDQTEFGQGDDQRISAIRDQG